MSKSLWVVVEYTEHPNRIKRGLSLPMSFPPPPPPQPVPNGLFGCTIPPSCCSVKTLDGEQNEHSSCHALTIVKTTDDEALTGPTYFYILYSEVFVHEDQFLHNLVQGNFQQKLTSRFLLVCQFSLKTGSEPLAHAFIIFICKSLLRPPFHISFMFSYILWQLKHLKDITNHDL